jgi:L-rhamnose mutarotase
MLPVKDHHGLYRDESTNAILNCNKNEYDQYLKQKNQRLMQISEITSIKEDISELKDALKMLIEKINK